MKIGIFTPIHKLNKEQLDFLVDSLDKQTYKNFVWIILLNGQASNVAVELYLNLKWDCMKDRILVRATNASNIGELKGQCVELAILNECDIALELDYDDALHPDCLSDLVSAVNENKDAQFFYSNFAHFNDKKESFTYGEYYGWKNREHKSPLFDYSLNEMIAFPPTPQYLERIESAPNHLRAFRVSAYKEMGGYDTNLEVGDDHDLMCRFFLKYGEKGFHHINKCLYYQRYDGTSTTFEKNKQIQDQVDANYCKYSEAMYLKWSKDIQAPCLDLGGRFNCPEGYKSVDLLDADFVFDLNKRWELSDNSVGVIRAYHLLEHLNDPIHFFNEAFRVLVPGGKLNIEVPSMRHPMAFADPTHKTFWTELNFEYYTNENKARFIRPQYKGFFQKRRIVEYPWPDGTLVISAQLVCFKHWYADNYWGTPPF